MKNRKICLPPALSSPSFATIPETTTTTTQPQPQPQPHRRYPDSPRDMLRRINGRVTANAKEEEVNSSSMDRTSNHHQDQELSNIVKEMNFTRITPAIQTLKRGWREEEKIMPLKKRRISFEIDSLIIEKEEIKNKGNIITDDMGNSNKEGNKKWVVSEADEYDDDDDDDGRKMEEIEDLMCVRTDGRKWRCKKKRAEGSSHCDHHLRLTRARHKYRKAAAIINAADADNDHQDDDDENKVEGFGKFDNEKKYINRKVKPKARSMNSLLRDTVPLLSLSL